VTLALELDGLHKRFGQVEALAGASLQVRPGTVHALLGENGAGKSTLMRIAFGMLRPDDGRLVVDGTAVRFASSADAIGRGIGMVHQHFTLVPAMTVAENVALGMRGRYDARATATLVRALSQRTGLPLDPAARVETLPVGAQQRLEIVKALARDTRILILDEPTAVLVPHEVDELLRWVRGFADDGHAVVLITHKLREALAVADDVTVLRHGRTVRSGGAAELSEHALVAALLGAEAQAPPGKDAALDESPGTLPDAAGDAMAQVVVLGAASAGHPARNARHEESSGAHATVAALRDVQVIDDRGGLILRGATLEVRAREIVGIAAVEGSGQRELLRLLAGRLSPTSGSISLPRAVAFVPEDRHLDALVLDLSLTENVALRGLARRRGRMPWRALGKATNTLLSLFDVRSPGADASARSLSGGNQQKLVLARELAADRQASDRAGADTPPALVVVENPTRGLDIRATAAVQEQLRMARDAGSAVVLYSSDLDEVLGLADRMLVVHAGRVIAVHPATRETVGRAMLGAE
jgi:general nucleoside transport system ATP-binding protein